MLERARAHHLVGRLDEAEAAYEACLAADARDHEALHLLATLRLQRGDAPAAVDLLRRAADAAPKDAAVLAKLGWALRSLGDLDEAVIALDRAVTLAPTLAAAWFYRGVVQGERGDDEAAAASYARAVDAAPDFGEAMNNLGRLCERRGDPGGAEDWYRRAVQARPSSVAARHNLASLLLRAQRLPEARAAFEAVLALEPEHATARHMVAALTGDTRPRAPAAYVRALFDAAAEQFEQVLQGKLDYRTPAELAALLDAHGPARVASALDIGVGTGLMGPWLRARCARLTGVDLSPRMLEVARRKGLYDELHVADLEHHLGQTDARFDLFVAADVLNYLGDLRPAFAGLRRCASAGAWLAFSVERLERAGYALQPSGRFRHAPAHVEALLGEHGFTVVARRTSALRLEGAAAVEGELFVAHVADR